MRHKHGAVTTVSLRCLRTASFVIRRTASRKWGRMPVPGMRAVSDLP